MKITPRVKSIHKIFKTIAITGLIVVGSSSPYFWYFLIKNYFNDPKSCNEEMAKLFYYLKHHGYIETEKKDGLIKIKLTERGKNKLNEIEIWDLKMKKPKKWDRKWRIVIFDIPKEKNKKRDIFRLKLKEFGFYQLQKSVWAFPHECKKEVAILRELLGIPSCVKLITTCELEEDEKILKHFKLLKDR